jgi:superfamily II DNA or RNA helicase
MTEPAFSTERCSVESFLVSMRTRSFPPFRHAILAAHQESAAARVLEMLLRYGGALLAEEVGLGKSYVAAAVAQTLQRRGMRVELIVPASLRGQWLDLISTFALDATLLTHEALARDPRLPESSADRIVIVDEAHRFRNPATRRFDALARRGIGAHVLLITATPICNGAADLQTLLSLVAADDALQHAGVGSIDEAFETRDLGRIATITDALMVRRDQRVLPPSLHFGSLDRAIVRHAMPGRGSAIASTMNALQFPLIDGGVHSSLLRGLLWRRLESSAAALVDSVMRQERFYRRALECLASGRTLTKSDYRRALAADDEHDAMQQVLFWECFVAKSEEVVAPELIHDELLRLQRIREHVAGTDEKLQSLRGIVSGATEPLLIFTAAAATARALFSALKAEKRCGLVTGTFSCDAAGRRSIVDSVLAAFRRGEIDVLIATDRSSEGLNLQRAGCVVHYDIPWNPVRLDQRNGRAHRIGQMRSRVRAIYFLPDRAGDASGIVATMATKNRIRRRMLPMDDGSVALVDVRERMLLVRGDHDATVLLLDTRYGARIFVERDGRIEERAAVEIIASSLRDRDGELYLLDVDDHSAEICARAGDRIISRMTLPPRLRKDHPAVRLLARLRRERLLDDRCVAIARPFRAGARRLIAEMAREFLDGDRVNELLATLAREPVPPRDERCAIVAMIRIRAARA